MIDEFNANAYPSLLAVSVSLEEISTLVPIIVVTIETVHRSLRGILARAENYASANHTHSTDAADDFLLSKLGLRLILQNVAYAESIRGRCR